MGYKKAVDTKEYLPQFSLLQKKKKLKLQQCAEKTFTSIYILHLIICLCQSLSGYDQNLDSHLSF